MHQGLKDLRKSFKLVDPEVSAVQYKLIRERLAELAEIGFLTISSDVDEAEGEPAIVELARASSGKRPLFGIPNVLTRDIGEVELVEPRYVRNLRLATREPIFSLGS